MEDKSKVRVLKAIDSSTEWEDLTGGDCQRATEEKGVCRGTAQSKRQSRQEILL
jgi:hypothetical protein